MDEVVSKDAGRKQLSRRKKMWVGVGPGALLLLFALMWVFWDAAPPDYSDLQPQMVELAKQNNAYTAFAELTLPPTLEEYARQQGLSAEAVAKLKDIRLSDIDPDLAKNYLAALKPYLDTVATLTAEPNFVPYPPANGLQSYNEKDPTRRAFSVLVMRAMRANDQEDWPQFLTDVTTLARLLGAWEKYPGTEWQNDRAINNMNELMFPIHWTFEDAKTPRPVLEQLAKLLPPAGLPEAIMAEYFRGEYQFASDPARFNPTALWKDMSRNSSGWQSHPEAWPYFLSLYNFLPNESRAMLAAVYRHDIQALKGPYSTYRLDAFDEHVSGYGDLLSTNVGGRLLVAESLPDAMSGDNIVKAYVADARYRLLRIGLAVHLYWEDHQQVLPPSLAALVPKYLPAVPQDPCDGKPLRYDAQRRILWSVGKQAGNLTFAETQENQDPDNPRFVRNESDLFGNPPVLQLWFADLPEAAKKP